MKKENLEFVVTIDETRINMSEIDRASPIVVYGPART